MKHINAKLSSAITAAFLADANLAQYTRTKSGEVKTHSKAFLAEAAQVVAKAASQRYKVAIVAYDGQRGIAFGVQVGTKENGEPKYERTDECNATRMWFARNIGGAKKAGGAPELKGVWAKIADGIKTLNTVMRDLKKDGDTGKAQQLKARIDALVNQYS